MKALKLAALAIILVSVAMVGTSSASLFVVKSVGGAPTGVKLDNLDWLTPGSGGGTSPDTGIGVTFGSDGGAVTGSVPNAYAAPFLSGLNGNGFGLDGVTGPDPSPYVTTGSTGSHPGANVTLALNGLQRYFGLLWGSVDAYNTLSFYAGNLLVGTLTGSQILANPNGDQGINGTVYVNVTSDLAFDKVVATSSNYAFEFDNVAFNETPVPEPASLVLLGLGLIGLGHRLRRR